MIVFEPLAKPALLLKGRFRVAGSIWEISTNANEILEAVRGTCERLDDEDVGADLFVSIVVDFNLHDQPPWPQPYYRGLDQFVYGAFGPGSSMLIDLQGRRVIASFSPAVARDLSYWKRILVPMILGTTSAFIGITPLHCACLVKDGFGLLLGGGSEAGKSTLSLSLALNGFAYLSDDWTYLSRSGSQVSAWGLPTPIKLLPDAVRFFPQLSGFEPALSQNGELAVEVDPVETFGVDRSLYCEPRWLVFLERAEEKRATFRRISSAEAFSRFASDLERLPECISDVVDDQLRTIRRVVERECWVLRHGLGPPALARLFEEFCKT
jgi:hypothetical protein